MPIYRFVVSAVAQNDPRSAAYLSDAHALGLAAVERIACQDLFFLEGDLTPAEADLLAARLLSDPLTQACEWRAAGEDGSISTADSSPAATCLVEVTLRPGVTDPVAEQVVRAAQLLGIPGVRNASTGQRFVIQAQGIDDALLRALAARLLANATIQRYAIGEIEPVFAGGKAANEHALQVQAIPVGAMDESALLRLSQERRAALDLEEMLAIRRYFTGEGRAMTDIEFETLAQTWSEHCVHKTFKARVAVQNPNERTPAVVDNLLKTYLRAATERINAPWVRSAFVDNAGILDFDDEYEVSFKVETHNHPSAIEPFGGANTGVGGVIRDVIGVSAKPIAATDVLCFGLPDAAFAGLPAGVLHPRRIRSGVVSGVQDYGNKIGLPTVSGAVLYDPGFSANPLVFCGCVGIAPKGSHPRDPRPGDRVIVLGGGTGRDGLRGATFSSMAMDAQTGEVAGASVQIGAPIVEKGLIDVIVLARDRRLYHAITDCGAGGLSSAVGEMANPHGADVDLQHVRLKYPGLAPWEIWLSEAQERMVLAVSADAVAPLQELCDTYAVSLTDIGCFTATGRLVVRYAGQVLLDLANAFLHDGIPQRQLQALLPERNPYNPQFPPEIVDCKDLLLRLLAHPNIASKAPVIRIYDHEVQGGTVIKPLTGAQDDGPSDAVVLKPQGTAGSTALVLSAGICPEYGKYDVYHMTLSAVDEAIRNAVAVGADPDRLALLDNFCWADPKDPKVMGELVESARGCYDAAVYYGTPFISGKDSLNNMYLGVDNQRHAIPPTLLISAIGVIADLARTVSMDLKQPGSLVYLVGDFQPRLGGSHLHLITGLGDGAPVPGMPRQSLDVYRALHQSIRQGLVRACHDLSEGGLAVSAAEMCIGGRLGMECILSFPFSRSENGNESILFGESNGCLLVEVSPQHASQFETLLSGLPLLRLGRVTQSPSLLIRSGEDVLIDTPVADLVRAWQTPN